MNTSQLEALLAVKEYGSMNRAAEHLYITQPALKKRLDSLEAELQLSLFERGSSGCRMTEAGKLLCDELPGIMRQMRTLLDKVQNTVLPKRLRISQVSLLTLRYCDKLIATFSRQNPDITVERVFMNNDLWLAALKEKQIDLCLVPGTDAAARQWQSEGMVPVPDGESRLAAIMSPNHPLAGRESIRLEELAPYPVFGEPIMLEYGGLSAAAEAAGVRISLNDAAFNRYSMQDACAGNCVFLHCIDLAQDTAPLAYVPVSDFSYGCFILLRSANEPALRTFREYLLSRPKNT